MIREHLLEAGVERARDQEMSRRAPLVIVWLVPSAVFRRRRTGRAPMQRPAVERRRCGWARKASPSPH